MGDQRVTLIISDLHVGGGPPDKGDDHIYQKNELVRFLRTNSSSAEGRAGRLELIINGDFLEFAQTNQAAFSHTSDDYWCTESESLRKLETIIEGHADIFEELQRFQNSGNLVTIAAGNHDVDLYWPQIQMRLRQVAGDSVRFELGNEWLERYKGKLQIGHGHMCDPANRFKHWDDPIRGIEWGIQRLEMCPGTLFMVKFVNKLEEKYPFADNLLPVTKLASILLHDDKAGLASIGWMFLAFATNSPMSVLGMENSDYGSRILSRIKTSDDLVSRLSLILEENGLDRFKETLRSGQLQKGDLAELMFNLLGRVSDNDWRLLFEIPSARITLGSEEITLSAISRANFDNGKETLRKVAQNRIDATSASVVVMGHTHQPDEKQLEGGTYYNPGSWTRYLELTPNHKITLEDLKDESKYPYQLNVVRIEKSDDESLKSEMICFEHS